MSENTKPAPAPNEEAKLSPPIEQAATALVEAAARFGIAIQPAYFAVSEIEFENGARMPMVMGPTRATLSEALADAALYGCGVALCARPILDGGDDDKPVPARMEPELPKQPAQLETMH